jgi:hypothetical protein
MTARFAVDPGIPTWCDLRVHASMEPSFEDVADRAAFRMNRTRPRP